MRLAVCALSAVLMSGCSWMGAGNNSSSSFGYGGGSACGAGYGAAQQGGYGYAQSGYGYSGGGCGMAGGYGQGAGAYGAGAYGQGAGVYGAGANGYGTGAGYGAGAGTGVGGYGVGYGVGTNGYGAGAGTGGYGVGAGGLRGGYGASTGGYGTGTVLGGAAPYGAAVGGAQYASSGQYINGQWVAGGTNTFQTVQGAPIYVPQPYPAYYGVGYNAGYAGYAGYSGYRGASAALPFGLEFGFGTEFGIGGDIVNAKPAGVATGGTLNVSATPAISYKDAYKKAVTYDAGMTYDISPSTTILGRLGYSKADGNRIKTGTIDDGTTTEDLYAQWGDLEQFTVEGGVRQYVGGWNNGLSGFRPYVGASAGFTHNNDVSLSQSSATLLPAGSNVQPYLDSGWSPTVAGVVGAEMQVGARTAIGVETGIRWRDDINSNVLAQEDRWSIPVKLRGRVSF